MHHGVVMANWRQVDADPAEGVLSFDGARLTLIPLGRFYEGELTTERAGTLSLQVWSPRPIRLWLDGTMVLDEELWWRNFQREVRACVLHPLAPGAHRMRVELGERPRHHPFVDASCLSRNRVAAVAAVAQSRPDELRLDTTLLDAGGPALSLRFPTRQHWVDGTLYQHVVARPTPGVALPALTTGGFNAPGEPEPWLWLTSTIAAEPAEAADSALRAQGRRRFHVPVATAESLPEPLRTSGQLETRPEPTREITGEITLRVVAAAGEATVSMPVYEPLGRLAPQREHRRLDWPDIARVAAAAPVPVLPPELKPLKLLYDEAWAMLTRLVAEPAPDSGLPNGFISTGSNFTNYQFVWDTAFAAMAAVYGHRALPAYASLDVIYSRQFDGGYIHRQNDVRDGAPVISEPDFSPNPPILSIAELAMARVTGDRRRLERVYPVLAAHHRWLAANRCLPDGTFWTSGLASGLDNTPVVGEGAPDLTAQMVHDAEALASIAELIGRIDDIADWRDRRDRIAAALNERLWDDAVGLYAPNLAGGGHVAHKGVTAFWPLWAGAAPADRAARLRDALLDPATFWRDHPVPSLSADSPAFRPEGRYWQGSVWPPTTYMVAKGFERAGYHGEARSIALRHLTRMADVLRDTGSIWENYASEGSRQGSLSAPDYCWSALGPIALLLENVIGLTPDALRGTLRWSPDPECTIGVRRYPLGGATLDLVHHHGAMRRIEAVVDRPVVLELVDGDDVRIIALAPGATMIPLGTGDYRSPLG